MLTLMAPTREETSGAAVNTKMRYQGKNIGVPMAHVVELDPIAVVAEKFSSMSRTA